MCLLWKSRIHELLEGAMTDKMLDIVEGEEEVKRDAVIYVQKEIDAEVEWFGFQYKNNR